MSFMSNIDFHFLNHNVERRNKESTDKGNRNHPAKNCHTDGVTACGTCAFRKHQRQKPEDECDVCHHNRPETELGSLQCRISDCHAGFVSVFCKLNNQNCLLCTQTD